MTKINYKQIIMEMLNRILHGLFKVRVYSDNEIDQLMTMLTQPILDNAMEELYDEPTTIVKCKKCYEPFETVGSEVPYCSISCYEQDNDC